MKYYEIGEEFEWNGDTYCVKKGRCCRCALYDLSCYSVGIEDDTFPECDPNLREDEEDVIFELV